MEIKAGLRHVTTPRTGRLVQEEVAIAGRRFRILIDSDDARLHMLITPAFSRGETARFLKRFEKGRMKEAAN